MAVITSPTGSCPLFVLIGWRFVFEIIRDGKSTCPSGSAVSSSPRLCRPRPPPLPFLLPPLLPPRYRFRPTVAAGPIGTPLLRLPSTPGDTPTAPTKLDALGNVEELQFADFVARFLHADWEREHKAEPTCHATMRYSTISRPTALPPDLLSRHPSHKRPPLSDIQELANIGHLRTTDDDIVLLLRNPTPPPTLDAPNSVG